MHNLVYYTAQLRLYILKQITKYFNCFKKKKKIFKKFSIF